MDEKLNWQAHIEHIKNKVIPLTGALNRCKYFLSDKARYNIYNTYFLPDIKYPIPIWCNVTNFNKVKVLQNRILKTLFNLHYKTPSNSVYEMLNVQPIYKILKLEQAKLIHKIKSKKQKCNIEIVHLNQVHDYNTRNCQDIHLPNVRTNVALRNPLSEASRSFNDLPQSIKMERSYKKFVKPLKGYLA